MTTDPREIMWYAQAQEDKYDEVEDEVASPDSCGEDDADKDSWDEDDEDDAAIGTRPQASVEGAAPPLYYAQLPVWKQLGNTQVMPREVRHEVLQAQVRQADVPQAQVPEPHDGRWKPKVPPALPPWRNPSKRIPLPPPRPSSAVSWQFPPAPPPSTSTASSSTPPLPPPLVIYRTAGSARQRRERLKRYIAAGRTLADRLFKKGKRDA